MHIIVGDDNHQTTISSKERHDPASQLAQATPSVADTSVADVVSEVISAIEQRGDAAVREYSEKFDRWSPDSFRLDAAQIDEIIARSRNR